MALNPSNSSSLEQVALKGLIAYSGSSKLTNDGVSAAANCCQHIEDSFRPCDALRYRVDGVASIQQTNQLIPCTARGRFQSRENSKKRRWTEIRKRNSTKRCTLSHANKLPYRKVEVSPQITESQKTFYICSFFYVETKDQLFCLADGITNAAENHSSVMLCIKTC